MADIFDDKIAVIGLGYVGLPLALAFGKKFDTVGFDINEARISELQGGTDSTLEASAEELAASTRLSYTTTPEDLAQCTRFIITVPTPIDDSKRPDLRALVGASRTVAPHLKKGDIVIFESTVYPGATQEDCVPELEAGSGLTCDVDFFVGYSPERINPGDKERRLETITKLTAGSTPEAAKIVDALYAAIIPAGTYPVSSIKVAEAAKVIENTQRDLNIALINELALIFNELGLDTEEVLKAAGTKWNFLPFRPGLVGGHCIGVDPYYLTHKAQSIGYNPQVILAGRRVNDEMGAHVASELIKEMMKRKVHMHKARVLVMGLTFKENCPDLRNTRVVDIVEQLEDYGIAVDVYDPWVDADEAQHEYGIKPVSEPEMGAYDGLVLAVAHQSFRDMPVSDIRKLGKDTHVLYDLKYILPQTESDLRL